SAEYKRRWREKRKRELEFLQNTDSDTDNALHKRNCNDIRNNFEIEDVDQAGIPTSEGSSRSTSPTPSISNSNETDSESDDDSDDGSETSGGNYSSSSDDDFADLNLNEGPTLADELRQWAGKNAYTRAELKDILSIFRAYGHADELPKDPRTLMRTPREVATIRKCGGEYIYLGIKTGIIRCLKDFPEFDSEIIKLIINADGIPLFKSNGLDLWPILGMFVHPHPFVISLYCGEGKPNNCEEYLEDLLNEYNELRDNGFVFDNKQYYVKIWCMLCDAPARQFIKCIKGHGGFYSCERCMIKGERIDGRTVFLATNMDLRTEEDFENFKYEGKHQHQLSPLVEARSGLKCIEGFPLDYMHLVCLGVMKRILQFLKEGPRLCRLSQRQIRQVSQMLQSFRGKMPSEFARQPRGLNHFKRFKATEFRSFLLYYGFIVLSDVLTQAVYEHFLKLVVALRILLDENDEFRNENLDYAKRLLAYFSDQAATHYSASFTVYNVHGLIHLADDALKYNVNLDIISCFPFENHLQILKKLVRNATNPLVSVVKRVTELESAGIKSSYKCILTEVSKSERDSWFLLNNSCVGCVKDVLSETTFMCADFFDKPLSFQSGWNLFFGKSCKRRTEKG
uniref:Uncharacterized protein n=1 Tax=Clytia hemisphaerica TaxID=252671 RepID=A0A7M5UW45_9CNID